MRRFKLLLHKLMHWEYWPYQVIYIPVYFQYVYFVLRTKSFFYFSASNPTIKNGGFFMESKKEIYDLIPQKYYPKTLLFSSNDDLKLVCNTIFEKGIRFPLIAKPNIGLRGTAVKKIDNQTELESYINKANFDFLIQEFIPFENEIGLFYVKLPDSKKGTITGIVLKEFLTVTGDGISSIKQLLAQNPRFELQTAVLEKELSLSLNSILEKDKRLNLVPYGNHCRGAKFLDASDKISTKLLDTFDAICSQIDGFYYGRMDIMFTNFNDLENGKNFQIVEINGAISEPTHIYDPKHSLFFAWKELIKHFYLMYQISKKNHKKGISYLSFKNGIIEFKNHFRYYNQILKF